MARSGSARFRSQWLRSTCAIACRCTERYRALLLLFGCAGIAGFCASSLGFFTGWLSEAQYLASVAGSLGMFAASVVIAYLGDPYELKRSECQRAFAMQALPVQPVSMSASRVRAVPASSPASNAIMN
jgi:hypothetical protein